jgi:hypothetical protein
MSGQQLPHITPAQQAILNWDVHVSKLEQWEQDEINEVRQMLSTALTMYQSSAALAIIRVSLEIGAIQGQ